MNNKELKAETEVQQSDAAEVLTSSQTIAKPNVSRSAFGVFPDSERLDLSDKNEMVAVFKYENQALIFGVKMWGSYFIVKPIVSEHFG